MKRLSILVSVLIFSTYSFAATPKNDAEVMNMLMTVNTEEMNLSTVGKTKSSNEKVKAFSDKMMKAHTNNNERAMSLQKSENLKLAESKPSMKTKTKAEDTVENLKTMEGKNFDKAYMNAQVKMHQDTLNKLDNELIPNAKNDQLKALLKTTKGHVQDHLKEAQQIQTSLQ
ncbi:DUF4142 domain-containing protein [Peredibacter sp. HCB2-198]|uniref:DUF4142 domain-containing protein n=1 Tax=Peredibacter sp. HCB2-198 TaxID=3383025 RepID=UPI0038B41969